MARLRLEQILAWTGGRLQETGEAGIDESLVFTALCTDTRSLVPGCLFVALRGQRFDGHDYAAKALAQGAKAVLVEKAVQATGLKIVVSDTLKAYQDLARGYRLEMGSTVIAVTGSVGKTTSREMIAACLRPFARLHATQANLNNEIGLPQTLLDAPPDAALQIVEMGMRAQGEIRLLSQIARPDIAVITGIGFSHVERLGSQEAIAAAKAEIIEGLRPGGHLVLNADDPFLSDLAQRLHGEYQIVGYSRQDENDWPFASIFVRANGIRPQAQKTDLSIVCRTLRKTACVSGTLPVPGLHLVDSLLCGLAIAAILGYDLKKALQGSASFVNVGRRQKLLRFGKLTVMDDSYNASPESVQAALQTLGLLGDEHSRRIAVLGSMLELGDFSRTIHCKVGKLVAESNFDALFGLGQEAAHIVAAAHSRRPGLHARSYADSQSLCRDLDAYLRPSDLVLVKGSRALRMERIVSHLEKKHAEET